MSAATHQLPLDPAGETVALPPNQRICRASGTPERKVFDQDYVNRLAAGEPQTESHFTNYFSALLLMKLRARVRSPQLIEDARQETFLRVLTALRRKGGIQHPERLGAYVNAVCENVLCEAFRAGGRFQQTAENAVEPSDDGPSPESLCLSEERKSILRRVMASLAGQDRQILRQVFLEDRNKDEICREMGIDRDYLRVRVHRALARVRAALAKQATANLASRAAG